MSVRQRASQIDLTDPAFKLAAVAIAGLLFLLLGYVTAPQASVRQAPEDASAATYVRGTIESIQGSRITLTTEAGPVSVELAPATQYEALRRGGFPDLRVGGTVNVGSIPHAQTLFVVVGVVVIPGSLVQASP